MSRFIAAYRPNAGVEALANLLPRIDAFATPRLESGRLGAADRAILHGVLDTFTIALAPFAPHLAEEVRHLLGRATLHARVG